MQRVLFVICFFSDHLMFEILKQEIKGLFQAEQSS